jgi:hypothetical protein
MSASEVTNQQLNLMAELDGEPPYSLDSEPGEGVFESKDEFVKAMTFTRIVRDALSSGINKEEIPEDWVRLIQDYDPNAQKQTAKPVLDRTNFLSDALDSVRSFFSPRYAFGGAFAFAIGLGLVIQMQNQQDTWEDSYAALEGVPLLQSQPDLNTFSGDYFERPQVLTRGLAKKQPVMEAIVESLSSSSRPPINAGQELDAMVLSIRAAELNGKSFSLVTTGDEKVWLSIRGSISAIDGEDRGDCRLVQISLERDGNPDLSTNNYFLQYCQQRLSNKLVPLGKSG